MDNMSPRRKQLLVCLTYLPHKIVSLHGSDNSTEFVLHELCQPACFNLKKAAYFVDNPDFDCLKGVAGFTSEEDYCRGMKDCWESPETFTERMRACSFNQKVRNTQRSSVSRNNPNPDHSVIVDELAQHLSLEEPRILSWPLKHHNQGILLFEQTDKEDEVDEHMRHGLHLLAFCPVF